MNSYKALNKQHFSLDEYSLVPIRFEDRFKIMKWRNEQIYHLRQTKPLTEQDQENYFKEAVAKLYEEEKPNQILFSFLKERICIGYGGLVHINWIDKNAEISFIMETSLEKDFFQIIWEKYLKLIEKVAFEELGLHKIYTYAFDLRPHLYQAVESIGFKKDTILKEHCFFEGKYIDVVIHSKIDSYSIRKATIDDLEITYLWASNASIRKFSFNQEAIPYGNHASWFRNKLNNSTTLYFIMENGIKTQIGSIRIDKNEQNGIISYLIDPKFQGRGFGKIILNLLEIFILENNLEINRLIGYVMEENLASIKIFEDLKYKKIKENDNLKFTKDLK